MARALGVSIQGETGMSRVVRTEVIGHRQNALQLLSSPMDDCNVCGKQWKWGPQFGRRRGHGIMRLDATEPRSEQELIKGQVTPRRQFADLCEQQRRGPVKNGSRLLPDHLERQICHVVGWKAG